MFAMAIVVASSDAEDLPMISLISPAPVAVRRWGKQYMIDAMREQGFPMRIAYSTAVGYYAEWMGLKGAPLLRAIWQAMEPSEGPEFCASFEAIFECPFWQLVHHLESEDEESEDEDCDTELETSGTTDALPAFHALFEDEVDTQLISLTPRDQPVTVPESTVNTGDLCLEEAEESPMTMDALADST